MSGAKLPQSVQVIVSRELSGSREYLLLLRRRAGTDDFWQPVSGSLEPGETFGDAAARELLEEVGLPPLEPPRELGLVDRFRIAQAWLDLYPLGVTHNVQAAFAARVGAGDVRLDLDEHVDAQWFSYDEARRLVRYEPNRRAIDLVEAGRAASTRRRFVLRARSHAIELGARTLVMGVLNVTPDSFSDGGRFADPGAAVDRALAMVAEGAGIIDVGGESSRPGAVPVEPDEEVRRVVPVIRAIAGATDVPISIDTVRAATAVAAFDAGASIVNDISALAGDTAMARAASAANAAVVLMHMRGTPASMQTLEPLADVVADVQGRLLEALGIAEDAGIAPDRVVLDPGIGFGKTADQNVELIARLSSIASLDRPLLVGTSRKAFLGHLTGRPVGERLAATTASVTVAVLRGAHILRVHDVAAAVDAARVADAILAQDGL